MLQNMKTSGKSSNSSIFLMEIPFPKIDFCPLYLEIFRGFKSKNDLVWHFEYCGEAPRLFLNREFWTIDCIFSAWRVYSKLKCERLFERSWSLQGAESTQGPRCFLLKCCLNWGFHAPDDHLDDDHCDDDQLYDANVDNGDHDDDWYVTPTRKYTY